MTTRTDADVVAAVQRDLDMGAGTVSSEDAARLLTMLQRPAATADEHPLIREYLDQVKGADTEDFGGPSDLVAAQAIAAQYEMVRAERDRLAGQVRRLTDCLLQGGQDAATVRREALALLDGGVS